MALFVLKIGVQRICLTVGEGFFDRTIIAAEILPRLVDGADYFIGAVSAVDFRKIESCDLFRTIVPEKYVAFFVDKKHAIVDIVEEDFREALIYDFFGKGFFMQTVTRNWQRLIPVFYTRLPSGCQSHSPI